MQKTIYLELDEEITSVIDKVRKAKVRDVTLVAPKRATLLQSIVNLKLLYRQAKFLGKNVILVTADKTGRNLAEKAGLKTKKELSNVGQEELNEQRKESQVTKENEPKIDLAAFLQSKPGDFPTKKTKIARERASVSDIVQTVKKEKIINTTKEEAPKKIEFKKKKLSLFVQQEDKKIGGDKQYPKIVDNPIGQKKKKLSLVPSINVKFLTFFVLISLAITGVIAFIILPKAEINIISETEDYSAEVDFVMKQGVEGVDLANNAIPAELVVAERESKQEKFDATGEKQIGEKAKGTVVVYNKYSSSPQPLVSSTRFMSADGKLFRLTRDVDVPGATIEGGNTIPGSIEVTLEADEAGDQYNINQTSFTIPGLEPEKQKDIYAESAGEFTGGISKVVKVVTKEDIDKAKDILLTGINSALMDELNRKKDPKKIIINSTTKQEIIETKTTVDENEEADKFEMKIKVKIFGMEFFENDLKTLLFEKVATQMAEEKYLVNKDLTDIEFGVNSFDTENQQEGIKAKINKLISWKINEQEIKESIAGMSKQEAEDYLIQVPHIKGVEVEFWPFWVKKVPKIDKKVKINLDFFKTIDNIDKQ